MQTFLNVLAWPFLQLLAAVKWFGQIFTEADGNGGKASFGRVAGSYVTINIVLMEWASSGSSSETMWNMFMVLVGYSLLAKVLKFLGPGFEDIARGWSNRLSQPRIPQEPKKTPESVG